MEQNNKPPKQYSGTKGLSLAIVIGVAFVSVIRKLMNSMTTGLMLCLVIGVMGWLLLFNRRQKPDMEAEIKPEENADKPENDKKE